MADTTTAPPPPAPAHTLPAGSTREHDWEGQRYLVTAEWLLLRKKEKPAAEVFHVWYRLASPAGRRPLTFVFNGGPGASSAFLHLGGLGPVRVVFGSDGSIPAPPARLAPNPESWLAFTDLVFIDPVGTGLSRVVDLDLPPDAKRDPSKHVDEDEYYALQRDLDSLGEFAERFLSRHKLWDVPVHLAGESYGGYRTAKLARSWQEKHGIGLTSVIAVSPALQWDFLAQTDYDVFRPVDTFCAMALAAAHHGRSRAFAPGTSLEAMRAEVEAFAVRTLAPALISPSLGGGGEAVWRRAADLLGLDPERVARAQGRVGIDVFARELLRDRRRIVGMYDATVTAIDPFPDRDAHHAPDPTLAGIDRVFAAGINHWLRDGVGLDSDRRYTLLNLEVNQAWKRDEQHHVFDTAVGATDDLRYAMSLNPDLTVLVTHGLYDLVTPYFASDRLVDQMKLLPEQRERLHVRHFPGGHMFYTWDDSRRAFADWVRRAAFGLD